MCFCIWVDDIYYVNENGNATSVLKTDGDIKQILHHPRKNVLMVVLLDGSLNTFTTEADGKLVNTGRVSMYLIFRFITNFTLVVTQPGQ